MAFRAEGWHIDLAAHLRRGGRVLGVCGGYQMLGRSIADPSGVEGPRGETEGLGLLDVATVLGARKKLSQASGESVPDRAPFDGYEMHMGETNGPDCARPALRFDDGRLDGAVSRDGLVSGVYVHGLFAREEQRAVWLRRLEAEPSSLRYEAQIDETLDALAEHIADHVDLDQLLELAR
jgi:adenosylcobyric acid synthase